MSDKITKDEIINAVLKTTFYKSTGATSLSDIANELGIKISCTEKPQGVFAVCSTPPAKSLKNSIKKDCCLLC